MSLAHLMHVLLVPDEEGDAPAAEQAPAPPAPSEPPGGGAGVFDESGYQKGLERAAAERERIETKAEAKAERERSERESAAAAKREEAWHAREEAHWSEEAARGGASSAAPAEVTPAPPPNVGGVVPHDWQGNVRIGGAGGSGEVHPGVAYGKAPIHNPHR